MRPSRHAAGISVAVLFLTMTGYLRSQDAKGPDARVIDARRQELKQLLADEWEYELRESPELGTIIGDYRYNDRWSDVSLAHTARQKQDFQKWLTRFEAIDPTGFPEQEKLNQSLMVRNLKEQLEGIDLKLYEMPVDQFFGLHLFLAQFVAAVPFDSAKHYEDYLARLHQVLHVVDEIIELLRQSMKDKLMPPRYLLEKTATQCRSIAEPAGEANVFGQPAANFPAAVPAEDRQRLHDAILAAVDKEVRPAYNRLASFIATEYAPKGRSEAGLWALPDGDARYRFAIRQQTTTSMEPEAIHQLGLNEVARIESEQLAIAKNLGFAENKSKADSYFEGTGGGALSLVHRADGAAIAEALRSAAENKTGGAADAGIPGERVVVSRIQSGHSRRLASGNRLRQYLRFRAPHAGQRGVHGVPRGRSGAPHADLHCADAARSSALPPAGQLHSVRRGLGALRRTARQGYRLLPGPLFGLRPAFR